MTHEEEIDQQEMDWTGHLGELRRRFFWSFIVFALSFGVGFYFREEVYNYVANDVPFQLTVLSPFDIIWVYVIIGTIVGFLVTIPFLALQLWLFIKPGLTKHEARVSLLYVPAIFILFALGLGFGYFIIKDLVLNFLLGLSDGVVNEMFTVNKYFRFIMQITVPFAFFFEVPLIAMFLTSLGVLTPDYMKRTRKYAYLILVILGTMLSPPDFILQLIVAAPLILLYELAIMTSGIVYKRRLKKLAAIQDQLDNE
ncbi:twin-arginine translocase subunit TatC [Alkalibacillus almallahensis]|uniref:twin-arginine translocase subunit TatC n=1 Tax=Alkalibacillus almallahensis TaxID=1379154 RepID=UPI001420FBDA|nr:twin-arginine translocase subunit TatC [Alkalibacillus almallahensis]NIK11015.1 sec-independent protein translocase protein TatC [Alkalibacillus almallahensis]